MSVLDIFLGDPIYDDQNRVVRREFGVKNVIAIAITLYVGNLLMGQMEPKSGGGKMKGGIQGPTKKDGVILGGFIIFAVVLFLTLWGVFSVAAKTEGRMGGRLFPR